MEQYKFSELYEMHELPDDVNNYVFEQIRPVLNLFPDLAEPVTVMMENARKRRLYTDKTRAMVFKPGTALPLVTMEFHRGVVKNYSYARFYGDSVYFPMNQKNKKVIFDPIRKDDENDMGCKGKGGRKGGKGK